jgi:nucleoid DNA-binding protein
MDIYLKDFSKILATYTRKNDDINLDSLQWRKILRILPEAIGNELAKGNRIHTPFGEYFTTENTQKTIKNSINGQTDVPIKYKRRAVCSCSRHFKEIINSDTRK